jgi:protein phosphatase 2C-like protein
MRIRARTLALPKAGNTAEEYEDAAWPLRSAERRRTRAYRCAVADGATETSFSGQWARLLVRAHCLGQLRAASVTEDVRALQGLWQAEVGSAPLPWYAEEKLRSGAYSSICGLSIEALGRWTALAVGDSCMTHVRGDGLCATFPMERSDEFSNRPLLVSSTEAGNAGLSESLAIARGEWQSGDEFFLMTDALAAWFLLAAERGECPWRSLRALAEAPRTRFERWTADQRACGEMRNDDVTLMRVLVE